MEWSLDDMTLSEHDDPEITDSEHGSRSDTTAFMGSGDKQKSQKSSENENCGAPYDIDVLQNG